MTNILEINQEEHWVRVEPGVIPDVLNLRLKEYGLFWGPETSTSNRNTLGGMVGNNSCGSHFPLYGNTRDHILEVKGFFADGSDFHFKPVSKNEILKLIERNSKKVKFSAFYEYSLSSVLSEYYNRKFSKESIRKEIRLCCRFIDEN